MADKTIKGLTKTLKALEKFGVEAEKGIDAIAEATANDIGADAKTNAPKNLGKLAQSVSSPAIKVSESNYKVSVTAPYAGYVEFGTGAKVRVPTEMQELASQLRQEKGTFEEGLQSIRDWVKSKGIDEDAAYPIFISILNKGIEPQPFLFPAFLKGRKNYLRDLKMFLNDLTKKYE